VSAHHLSTGRQARGSLPRAIVLILSAIIVAAACRASYWYRVSRREPDATARIPYIKWTKSFGGEQSFVTSPVLADDGSLYLASVRGNVYSLYPSSAVRWEYHLREFIAGGLLQDAEENIYFTTLTEVLSVTPSGRKRWETTCSEARMWQDDQGGTFDGNVLYTECGKAFCALNKDDGSQIWTRPALDSESTPVMLKEGVLVFVSESRLVAVDRDGKMLWTWGNSQIESQIDTPIAVGFDETLYAGSRLNQNFVALDAHGTLKWSFNARNQGFRSSPVIASDGTIYVITFEGLLYALTSDGAEKWRFQLPKAVNGEQHAAPVLGSDGTIYLLAEQRLIALSPERKLLWTLPVEGTFGGSPALANDGTFYVPTLEGGLYAVQTESRGLMRSAWPRYQHDSSNSGRAQARSNK
jgi:outer membrane protein assembly factor BamB